MGQLHKIRRSHDHFDSSCLLWRLLGRLCSTVTLEVDHYSTTQVTKPSPSLNFLEGLIPCGTLQKISAKCRKRIVTSWMSNCVNAGCGNTAQGREWGVGSVVVGSAVLGP